MKQRLAIGLFVLAIGLQSATGFTQEVQPDISSGTLSLQQPTTLPTLTYQQKVVYIHEAMAAQKEANERLKERTASIRQILEDNPCQNPKAALELKYAGSLPPVPAVEEVLQALKQDTTAASPLLAPEAATVQETDPAQVNGQNNSEN